MSVVRYLSVTEVLDLHRRLIEQSGGSSGLRERSARICSDPKSSVCGWKQADGSRFDGRVLTAKRLGNRCPRGRTGTTYDRGGGWNGRTRRVGGVDFCSHRTFSSSGAVRGFDRIDWAHSPPTLRNYLKRRRRVNADALEESAMCEDRRCRAIPASQPVSFDRFEIIPYYAKGK